nr:hypothetical protein [Frigoribacterium sp. PvP032]
MPDADSMPAADSTTGAAVTPEVAATEGPRTSPFAGLARTALLEITPDETIGAEAPPVDEVDGVVSVRFATLLPGYPGWFWTVSVAQVEGSEPTVLEVELLPGDHSLIAPDWVPWADRLAEMQAQEAGDADPDDEDSEDDEDPDDEDSEDEDDDSDDDDDTEDDDTDEDDGPRPVHGGDVDGVDIDDLDDDEDDSDEDEDEGDTDEPVVPAADPEADADDDSHGDDWDGEDEDPLPRRRR